MAMTFAAYAAPGAGAWHARSQRRGLRSPPSTCAASPAPRRRAKVLLAATLLVLVGFLAWPRRAPAEPVGALATDRRRLGCAAGGRAALLRLRRLRPDRHPRRGGTPARASSDARSSSRSAPPSSSTSSSRWPCAGARRHPRRAPPPRSPMRRRRLGAGWAVPLVRAGAARPPSAPCWPCSPASGVRRSRWPASVTCRARWPRSTRGTGSPTPPRSSSASPWCRWCCRRPARCDRLLVVRGARLLRRRQPLRPAPARRAAPVAAGAPGGRARRLPGDGGRAADSVRAGRARGPRRRRRGPPGLAPGRHLTLTGRSRRRHRGATRRHDASPDSRARPRERHLPCSHDDRWRSSPAPHYPSPSP